MHLILHNICTCYFFPYRTFDYVEKELKKVPDNIPVLIIGNHCDMAHHRTINMETVKFFVESWQRYSITLDLVVVHVLLTVTTFLLFDLPCIFKVTGIFILLSVI